MKKTILIAVAVGLGLMAVAAVGALRAPAYEYAGTHIAPPMPAAPFTLESADGPVSLEDLEGRAVAMFFGYTSCPDVCPTTLLRLAEARERLDPELRERVQVVFVSVDPERDSPERASAYARAVDPSFIGLSGSPSQVDDVAARYGIYHAKAEGSEATGYLVDHTATVTVLDPRGRVALLWSPTVDADGMAGDLAALLDG